MAVTDYPNLSANLLSVQGAKTLVLLRLGKGFQVEPAAIPEIMALFIG